MNGPQLPTVPLVFFESGKAEENVARSIRGGAYLRRGGADPRGRHRSRWQVAGHFERVGTNRLFAWTW